jgi:hypothetical protein
MPNTTTIAAMASSMNDLLRDHLQVSKDPSAQSKEFIGLPRLDPRLRVFGNGNVAPQQLNLCSWFGTAHFDLRRLQRGLSSSDRGWGRIS